MSDQAQETGQTSTESAGSKKKKINRHSAQEINRKIEALESANQTKSVYYKHLLNRRAEMQG